MNKQTSTLKIFGKYSDSGRWAQVRVNKYLTMPTEITCAIGNGKELKALTVFEGYKLQKDAIWAAKNWVATGREVY